MRVIAMGGYNTVCEVLSFAKPALIIPRVRPRREQIIRAQRLCDLDLIDMLHPEALSARALSDWMARDVAAPEVQGRIDLDGLSRLPGLLAELLADSHSALHEGPYYLDAI
jgi:predicted glycosyltransferase